MPLVHNSSDAAFKTNVKTLMGEIGKSPHVKDRNQALAIAYATKRRGKAEGGPVDPEAQKILDDNKFRNLFTYYLGRKSGKADGGKTQDRWQPRSFDREMLTPQKRIEQGFDSPFIRIPEKPQFQLQETPGVLPPYQGRYGDRFNIASGGFIPGFAPGGAPQMPWFSKNEARGMTHVGPISSIVPGRTDRHQMSVASGSYIVPADVVSHIGQNNTAAGHAVLSKMFNSGPYGTAVGVHAAHSAMPRLKMKDYGGGIKDGGQPVEIVTAGGEFTIPPPVVKNIGRGDIDFGHKVLDAWVMNTRKDHIKTLKNLPPPAQK